MNKFEPVGGLYEVEVLDTSTTASGLILGSAEKEHLLVRILQVPIRKRMTAQGFYLANIAREGELVIIHRNNLVEIKVGAVNMRLTSDDAIIAVES